MADKKDPLDRRVEERSDCELTARIELAGGGTIPCTVRDLSEAGVKIRIDRSAHLPDQFALFVPAIPEADQRFDVKLIWRNGEEAGGEFVRHSG